MFIPSTHEISNPTNIGFTEDEKCDHPEFVEFMRRVPSSTKSKIEGKLAALKNPQELERELLLALNKRWGVKDPIIMDLDMPYIALYAFKHKKISRVQIGSLLHFWAAIQHHNEAGTGIFNPEIFDFFNEDGTVNEKAIEVLKETFSYPLEDQRRYPFAITLEKPEEWARFVEEMRKLPRSEQQFSKIPCLLPLDGETILETLSIKSGYRTFGLLLDGKSVILETMGMTQAFINALRNGDGERSKSSIQLNIVIGLSSNEDIERNGVTGTRDTAVHFPEVELPRNADGRVAFWIYFTKHDGFHAASQKVIGAHWSSQFVGMWQNYTLVGTPEEQRTQDKIKERFIDMDGPALRHPTLPRAIGFWEHFAASFSDPFIRSYFPKYAHLSPETEDEVLRQLFSKLIEIGNPEIAKGPETGFASHDMNPFIYRIKSYFPSSIIRTRIYKQIPKIWKEQKVASRQFLDTLKVYVRNEKDTAKVKEKVNPILPYLNTDNAFDLLEVLLENKHTK